jgi:hypothetical protein
MRPSHVLPSLLAPLAVSLALGGSDRLVGAVPRTVRPDALPRMTTVEDLRELAPSAEPEPEADEVVD